MTAPKAKSFWSLKGYTFGPRTPLLSHPSFLFFLFSFSTFVFSCCLITKHSLTFLPPTLC